MYVLLPRVPICSVKRSLLLTYQAKLLELRQAEERRLEEVKKAAAVASAGASESKGDDADVDPAAEPEEVDFVIDRRGVYTDMCSRILARCEVCRASESAG